MVSVYDLMLGDYVLYGGRKLIVCSLSAMTYDFCLHLADPSDPQDVVAEIYHEDLKEVHPILLTPEMLWRNGYQTSSAFGQFVYVHELQHCLNFHKVPKALEI